MIARIVLRRQQADKIRVCYTVAKNKLVGAGDKELYVQVLDPQSNVLGVNEQIQFGDKTLNFKILFLHDKIKMFIQVFFPDQVYVSSVLEKQFGHDTMS